jgi:hypothetical protein
LLAEEEYLILLSWCKPFWDLKPTEQWWEIHDSFYRFPKNATLQRFSKMLHHSYFKSAILQQFSNPPSCSSFQIRHPAAVFQKRCTSAFSKSANLRQFLNSAILQAIVQNRCSNSGNQIHHISAFSKNDTLLQFFLGVATFPPPPALGSLRSPPT